MGAPLVRYCPSSRHYLFSLYGEDYAVQISNNVPLLDETTAEQLERFVDKYRLFSTVLLPDGCSCATSARKG